MNTTQNEQMRPQHHWIDHMIKHDAMLDRVERSPEGTDYNEIFPTGLGLIWHMCKDVAEFYIHAITITTKGGVIKSVSESDDGVISVIFAITHENYKAMIGREPDREEWLEL